MSIQWGNIKVWLCNKGCNRPGWPLEICWILMCWDNSVIFGRVSVQILHWNCCWGFGSLLRSSAILYLELGEDIGEVFGEDAESSTESMNFVEFSSEWLWSICFRRLCDLLKHFEQNSQVNWSGLLLFSSVESVVPLLSMLLL